MTNETITRRGMMKGIASLAATSQVPIANAEEDEAPEKEKSSPHPAIGGIAIGTGSAIPHPGDTQLENEVHRSYIGERQVKHRDVSYGTSDFNEIETTVKVGVEMPAGIEVSEIGLLGKEDDLLIRRTFPEVLVNAGDRCTFMQTIHSTRNSLTDRNY